MIKTKVAGLFMGIFVRFPGPLLSWACEKILKVKECKVESVVYRYGVLNVGAGGLFYKIEVIKGSLDEELKNRKSVSRMPGPISSLLSPWEIKRRFGRNIMVAENLESPSVQGDMLVMAVEMLRIFKSYGHPEALNNENESPEFVRGIEVVADMAGPEKRRSLQAMIEKWRGPARTGPSHGDFHRGNMMKDMNGKMLLIDWDCFRPKGIQAIDAIYFIVENEVQINRNAYSWVRQLILFCENGDLFGRYENVLNEFVDVDYIYLCLIYFVDRLGQNTKYLDYIDGSSSTYRREIDQAVSMFLSHESLAGL